MSVFVRGNTIVNIDNEGTTVVPNNAVNRQKQPIHYACTAFTLQQTPNSYIFNLSYDDMTVQTLENEFNVVNQIVENIYEKHDMATAKTMIAALVQIKMSEKLRYDLLTLLLQNYYPRIVVENEGITIDHKYVVDYKGSVYAIKDKHYICIVPRKTLNAQWTIVQGKQYLIDGLTCAILSKTLYTLNRYSHKNDTTLWNQIRHYEGKHAT